MRYAVPDIADGAWHETELEIERSRFITWTATSRTRRPSRPCWPRLVAPIPAPVTIAALHRRPSRRTERHRLLRRRRTRRHRWPPHVPGAGRRRTRASRLRGHPLLRRHQAWHGRPGAGLRTSRQRGPRHPARREVIERRPLTLRVDFAGEAGARAWCGEHDIPIEHADYQADGVILTLGWPSDMERDLEPLNARLKGRMTLLDTP